MDEKRRFFRCKVDQKATVSTPTDCIENGLLSDVSMGGMRVVLDRSIQEGAQLSGQFQVVPYLGPFYVQGEVVWTKSTKAKSSSGCEAGVKFTKIRTFPEF